MTEPGCAMIYPESQALQTLLLYGPDYKKLIPFTFYISGVSYETVLELIAHSEARIDRLPRLDQMKSDSLLYRIQGEEDERAWQKAGIRRFLELRGHEPAPSGQSFELCTRAAALSYTMTLGDFHKLFVGRLSPQGNEVEIQEVCAKMCRKLHEIAADIIHAPETYYGINNSAKY